MLKQIFLLMLFGAMFCMFSCDSKSKEQEIVDKAIERHGGERFEDVHVAFDFRDRHYTYTRDGGTFTYTREFEDSTGRVRDVLQNEGFYRTVNTEPIVLTDERTKAYSNSVNSVLYFSMLPYGLNDAAVNKEYVKQTELEGQPYHLIQVSFEEEGGGEDFEDQFLYWIHTENNTVDYLAYKYHTEGGGLRFRKAVNPREIGGIRFQDYINYKPASEKVALEDLEQLYKQGELEVVSEIKLENIVVDPEGNQR